MSRSLHKHALTSGRLRLFFAGAAFLQTGCFPLDESGGDTPSGIPSDGGPATGDTGSAVPRESDAGVLPDLDDGGQGDAGAGPVPPFPVGTSEQTLVTDGVERAFTLHVPAAAGAAPKALVLVLHGSGGSTPTEIRSALSVFIDVADREGFVVAFPKGLPSEDGEGRAGWVDCRGDSTVQGDADDVGFLTELIVTLRTRFGLESPRVFMAGNSNGALMTFALVKHRPDLLGAVATANANLPAAPRDGPCAGSLPGPMPILLAHGTADPVMPYDGGCVGALGGTSTCTRGTVVSASDTVAAFRQANATGDSAEVTTIDVAQDDGGAAVRHVYVGPAMGAAPVEWWKLEGAGHTLPSRTVNAPTVTAGGTQNRDVEFAEIVWDFFAHRLPAEPPPETDDGMSDPGVPDAGLLLPVGVSSDVAFPETPGRLVDAYVPSAAPQRVVVFLHGGGGTKEGVAGQLGLSDLTQPALDALGAVWMVPQGESLGGNPATWSNHVMTSDEDDVAYLTTLAGVLRGHWPSTPIVLAGHSNGGMMTHRMWCEAGSAYDEYMSVAGPPSVRFDPDLGELPCVGVRPYWAIVGDTDRVLNTEGNGLDATWTIDTSLVDASPEAFLNPTLINEARAHRALRARGLCPESTLLDPVDVPATAPRRREWSDCGGRLRFWWVRAQQPYPAFGLGNHTIRNLEEDGDFVLRDLIADGFD